jgi:hypothetical protein
LRAPDPRSGGAGGHLEFFYYKLTVEEDAPPPKRNPRDGLKDLADRGFEASGGFLWALGLILEPFPASLAGWKSLGDNSRPLGDNPWPGSSGPEIWTESKIINIK